MPRISRVLTLVLVLSVFFSSLGFSDIKEEEKFRIAAKAFSDDFYDASLSLFKKFIEDFPKSPSLHEAKLYIAKCYYHRGDYKKALETFAEIEKSGEGKDILSETYHWLSIIYFRGKGFKEVLSYAQKVIDDYPDSKFIWKAYYLIGSCNLELGRIEKAEEIFSKIIAECAQEEVINNTYSQILSIHLKKE